MSAKKRKITSLISVLLIISTGFLDKAAALGALTASSGINQETITATPIQESTTATSAGETITSATPAQQNAFGTNGYILGLDISRYQHNADHPNIDFVKAYNKGVRFVYINGGNSLNSGSQHPDDTAAKYYQSDRAAAQAAGLHTGFYYFVHFPNTNKVKLLLANADNQANKVINRLNQNGGLNNLDLPVALDVETLCTTSAFGFCKYSVSRSAAVNWILEFNKDIYNATGKIPLIYSYQSFLTGVFGSTSQLKAYPLWIATAGISPSKVPLGPTLKSNCGSFPWAGNNCQIDWSIWQYTSNTPGKDYGIGTGGVDTDLAQQNFINFGSQP